MVEGIRTVSLGVDDLLSGAVGALLVALITVAYTEVRESRTRTEGVAGLARLLLNEVSGNNEGELTKPELAPEAR